MAAKKVTIMVGFVPIATRMDVAVDKESSDAHAVCTGTEDKPHDPTRVATSVGCTEPGCGIKHTSVFGFPQRGVERDGKLVVLAAEDLARASGTPRTGRATEPPIQIAFHPREKVYDATEAGDSVQNVYPDKGAEKAYALLRDNLAAHPDIVAVMIWAPAKKNALWTLEVVGRRIVATKRCWPEDVRPTLEIPDVDVLAKEQAMFSQLIESSVEDFDLLTYVDESKQSIEDLVASHASGAFPVPLGAPPAESNNDLLAKLAASLEVAKPRKPVRAVKAPAKKAAAKKAVAKKAVAKKRPAKKANPLPASA